MGLEISSVSKMTTMTKKEQRKSRNLRQLKIQMLMEMGVKKFQIRQVNRTVHRMLTTEKRNQRLSLRKINEMKIL